MFKKTFNQFPQRPEWACRRQVQLWILVLLLLPLYLVMFSTIFAGRANNSEHQLNTEDKEKYKDYNQIYDTSKVHSLPTLSSSSSGTLEDKPKEPTLTNQDPVKRDVHEYLAYDPNSLPSSPSYEVHPKPLCWSPDCSPYEANNNRVYAKCSVRAATYYNTHGVINMERLVANANEEARDSPGVGNSSGTLPSSTPSYLYFHHKYLQQAAWNFRNATEKDENCAQPFSNLAITLLHLQETTASLAAITRATTLQPDNEYFWAIQGFVENFVGKIAEARISWSRALQINPFIGERKYFGIMLVNDTHPERHFLFPNIREYNREIELEACLKFLTYIEFSRVSIGNYPNIPFGAQESFIKNRYYVIRDIVPAYILHAMARAMEISRNSMKFGTVGDYQAKRFNALNDRTSRTLQYQLVDLWRRIVLHNVVPSYSFYGGYQSGATLPPHTDKLQCEFTVSLTLNQFPYFSPWTLSLGSRVKFDRDEVFIGDPVEKMPPEDEIVDVDLFPGDALIFMGRHMTHFRRKTLEEGHWLDQVFVHHVQDTFGGSYDI